MLGAFSKPYGDPWLYQMMCIKWKHTEPSFLILEYSVTMTRKVCYNTIFTHTYSYATYTITYTCFQHFAMIKSYICFPYLTVVLKSCVSILVVGVHNSRICMIFQFRYVPTLMSWMWFIVLIVVRFLCPWRFKVACCLAGKHPRKRGGFLTAEARVVGAIDTSRYVNITVHVTTKPTWL